MAIEWFFGRRNPHPCKGQSRAADSTQTGHFRMAGKSKSGEGTREHPWHLKTPSGTSEFQAFRDEALDPPALVVKSGSTELRYHLRCIDDLH